MATYDPAKSYSWQPEDKFEISGRDFGIILNTFRAVLSTEEAKKIQMTAQASLVMEGILANAVEANIAKENLSTKPE